MANISLSERCIPGDSDASLSERDGRLEFYCLFRGADLNEGGVHCNRLNGSCQCYSSLLKKYQKKTAPNLSYFLITSPSF